MTAQRRMTVLDLPSLCGVFAVILLFCCVVFLFGWRLDVVATDSLQSIEGRVERIAQTNKPKAGRKLHIYVRTTERLVHLTQDDLTVAVPKLKELQPGDLVVALAKHDSLWRDLDWLWELTREGETILTYDQTLALISQSGERLRPLGYGSGVIGLLLAAVSLFLRQRFGAWQSSP